ncbi:uncharacterized protein ARMOST_07497 [Armillaria ostoyae]|uniref:Uncharacterized protein n=1 Tax=Armillaria ostoyae TaxID=47428 RepID=A0A284R5Z6_ARMOS|nr:uncharacterized protein ARMOST_07497 [Armillaria ostoyae]
MTPDELTITIVSAIGGACLLSLLVSLLVLANVDRLRRLLRIRPLTPPPAFPMSNPDHSWNQWARSTPPPPRDGRPMPTPPPTNTFPLAMQPPAHQMFQEPPLPPMTLQRPRSMAGSFGLSSTLLRPPYPSSRFPTAPRPPSGPSYQNPTLRPRAHRPPSTVNPFQIPSPPGSISFNIPAHLCPLPDSDSKSDSSDYGGNEPVAEREDDDPLNPNGQDYEWPELDAIDRAFLGPYRSQA